MTVRPLFLLLTCAGVLGALVWVMLTDPEGPSPAGATSSTTEEQSAAPQLAETSLAEQNQPAADREASGYRVRVLLPDGTPQAHAKLRVARDVINTSEQAWQTAVRFPDQILWQAAGWDEGHADAEGEVTLAGPGPVVAAVLSPDHCGHVVCGMDPETFEARPPEDGAEAAVLQLHAQSMIEVLPLSAEGELLKEGIFLSGSARVARGPLYRDGEPMRRISAAVGKLPDGRWFFSRTLSAKSKERFGDRMEDLAYRVDLRLGRLEVGADFDAQTAGPLELRLPAYGEMLLTLQGYPEGVRPFLFQADGRINSRDTFARPQREGEAFLIPQVPVGQEYEVCLMTTPHPDDPQPVLRGVGPEVIRVAGPQAAGERVAHTLVFQAPPGSYYGRLVLPEDCEWEPWQVFGSRARSWKARMVLAEGLQYTDTLDLTLYPGGEFVARVPYRVRESQHPEWIGDVLFEFEDARPLWVVSSQAMPSFDQAVDLGEVQLSRDHALLRVRVVDQAGDPIEGAKVERSLLQSAAGEEAKWGHAWGSPQARTQEDGELWITDRDWYTELQLFPPESGKSSSQRIERLRVEVSAEGHLTQRQEFGPQTRELTVVLPRAATVYGSLGPVPARTTLNLGFCEPGRSLQEESSQLLPVERVSTRETEDMLEFEIASVPAGSWDFVVQVNGLGLADGLRIPGVVISGEPEQELDALQNIPLGDWMGVYE